MPTLFKVESADIKDLNPLQLTKLLKLLLYLEARSSGIAERAVEVALNITVPDGGEDGRIQWRDGPPHTSYLPNRFVQFQNKATDMGPADCANEIVNSDGLMKHMIEQALDNGAAYILFNNKELKTQQKTVRIASIREKLAELDRMAVAGVWLGSGLQYCNLRNIFQQFLHLSCQPPVIFCSYQQPLHRRA